MQSEAPLTLILSPLRAGRAFTTAMPCIGTMNLPAVRRHRQGAAGILPAVLSSDWPAGKMPAAPCGSWRELERTLLGSLFGVPDTMPPKVPLSLCRRERVRVRVRLDCMDTAETSPATRRPARGRDRMAEPAGLSLC